MPHIFNASQPTSILTKTITSFGAKVTFACDMNCNKAFGINGRAKEQLSEDEDDYRYLTDSEVGDAPKCMGTWEGGDGKPTSTNEAPNKWCVRECERSTLLDKDNTAIDDFSLPVYNFNIRAKEHGTGNKAIPVVLIK